MKDTILLQIYKNATTVFTVAEIAQMVPQIAYESLLDRLYYLVKTDRLIHLRQGIYAKKEYNPLELANKIYTPSYISLETVLSLGNVIFQHYTTIFVVSYVTRAISVGQVEIQYRRMHPELLTHPAGVEQRAGYAIASLERAFLDAIYVYKDYHFDNLGAINWERVEQLTGSYHHTAFEKRVASYYRLYKHDYV